MASLNKGKITVKVIIAVFFLAGCQYIEDSHEESSSHKKTQHSNDASTQQGVYKKGMYDGIWETKCVDNRKRKLEIKSTGDYDLEIADTHYMLKSCDDDNSAFKVSYHHEGKIGKPFTEQGRDFKGFEYTYNFSISTSETKIFSLITMLTKEQLRQLFNGEAILEHTGGKEVLYLGTESQLFYGSDRGDDGRSAENRHQVFDTTSEGMFIRR